MEHTQSWEEDFDNEVDRLVARSLRDPNFKPLSELKTFISHLLTENEQKVRAEERAKVRNRTISECISVINQEQFDGPHSDETNDIMNNIVKSLDALALSPHHQ